MGFRLIRWVALLAFVFTLVFSSELTKESFQFKSDVSKMLDIIIHSLYTNRNIFLREIISNASDALDKIRFLYLTEPKDPKTKDNEPPTMDVRIKVDKEARTLTVMDGGIGMAKEDLINHLGSLGTSGTKKFLEQLNEGGTQQALNMIGQFGVGFYSVFLVSDNVKVASKHDSESTQWVWESTADGNFFIYEDPRGNTLGRGTEITLELKKDADEYLDAEKLKGIVKQYSEFIHFPIYIQTATTEQKEPEEEGKEETDEESKAKTEPKEVTTYSWELLNENKPIWTRKPADISKEDYNNFFKALTKEVEDPLYFTHFSAEGEVEFKSILYIPSKSPMNLFDPTQTALTNIRLYVRRVFITDEFKDLLPRYLNFIKGVVDSDDLPLNVSRELLQENRILKIIKKKLVRKALSMLKDIADTDEKQAEKKEEEKSDEDKAYKPLYPRLWEEFGKNLRLGLIEDAANRARLTKLLRYKSSKYGDQWTSLEDYVERMPETQKSIFYLTGESVEQIKKSPLLEQAVANNVEVLYMTDPIDEYVVGHVTEFSGKKLVSLAKEGVKLKDETERDKKIAEKRKLAWEPFTNWLKNVLASKVEKVVLSTRVTETPCVLVSPQYGVTANMERILKGQALADLTQAQTAKRIMEINPRHPIVDELRRRAKENEEDEVAKEVADALYQIAALQSGYSLDDVNAFAAKMHRSLKQGLNLEPEAGLVEEEEYDLTEEEAAAPSESEGEEEEEEGGNTPPKPPASHDGRAENVDSDEENKDEL